MNYLSQNREIILSKLVRATGVVSSSDILQNCNISRKTLISDITGINDYLKDCGAQIVSEKGKGYIIHVDDRKKYDQFCTEFLLYNRNKRYLYLDRNDLAYQIAIDLLLCDEYITIENLAERYSYSRRAISQKLKTARSFLQKYNCDLVSRPHHGLKVECSEWSRRVCLCFAEKISRRLSSERPTVFKEIFDREKYFYPEIEAAVSQTLDRRGIFLPKISLAKVNLYIILSQSRLSSYDKIEFPDGYKQHLEHSAYHDAATEIAEVLSVYGLKIGEKDIYAVTALLKCYASHRADELQQFPDWEENISDTRQFLVYIQKRYPEINDCFDASFLNTFSTFLHSMKERIYFCLPIEDESVFVAKQDGVFIADLCREFAVFYDSLHGIRIPEAELLSAYYIFSASFLRNAYRNVPYSAVLVSKYGLNYADSMAEKALHLYPKVFSRISTMEFREITPEKLRGYHFLMTDIEQRKFIDNSLPIIQLDYYRKAESRSLDKLLSRYTRDILASFFSDSRIISGTTFSCKEDVFSCLADMYVAPPGRSAFFQASMDADLILSAERRNGIALMPVPDHFIEGAQAIIFINKNSFIWKNELTKMIIFYNWHGRSLRDIRTISAAFADLLHGPANIVETIAHMRCDDMVSLIVEQTQKQNVLDIF